MLMVMAAVFRLEVLLAKAGGPDFVEFALPSFNSLNPPAP